MEIGIRIWPSKAASENDPGHLFVYWITDEEPEPVFRGFGFRPKDLPAAVRSPEKWRDYLFDHKVPGFVDGGDPRMADEYFQARTYLDGKRWDLTDSQLELLRQQSLEGPQGWYSFNPDQHNSQSTESLPPPDRCHNCVTWGITLLNETLNRKVLWRIRNGRIKRILRALKLMRECEARRQS